MTILPPNDRKQTRLETRETIFIEVLSTSSGTSSDIMMCNSLDLSESGLQVVVDSELVAGSIFRLCIDLKNEEPLFLVGEVMWCRPDESQEAFRLGFQLFDSEGTDIDRWKQVLATMLASNQFSL